MLNLNRVSITDLRVVLRPSVTALLVCLASTAYAQPEVPDTATKSAVKTPTLPDLIEYYRGESQGSSPDGKVLYGVPRVMLLKRVISPSKKMITEFVNVGLKAFRRVLSQVDDSVVFKIESVPFTHKGTITFAGEAWQWKQWTYAVDLLRVGSMVGTAILEGEVLKINHKISGPKGSATGQSRQNLKRVKSNEYLVALRAWEQKRGPPSVPFR